MNIRIIAQQDNLIRINVLSNFYCSKKLENIKLTNYVIFVPKSLKNILFLLEFE